MADLTILLTLRGRHLHTLRWLWHAERTRLPYHVIVADGEVHPAVDRVLSDRASFPSLSYEYHRYADRSFSDFYAKCVDALRKVRTPYVKMADNDDFLFPSGVQQAVDFLDAEPDYVCAGSGIPGFSLLPRSGKAGGVVGAFRRITYRCWDDGSYDCRDLDQPSVAERALDVLNRYLSLYYYVYRTPALTLIAEDIAHHDFSDLDIHERYWALRAVTLGKARSDPSRFFYFRQDGTSSRFSFSVDWVHHLLGSRLPQDFSAMAATIARAAAAADRCDAASLRERMREGYAAILRTMLANTLLLRTRFPRLFRLKQLMLSVPRPRLPARLRRDLDERNLWARLSADGATAQTLQAHRRELSDIAATLSGEEFLRFVADRAPELLNPESAGPS